MIRRLLDHGRRPAGIVGASVEELSRDARRLPVLRGRAARHRVGTTACCNSYACIAASNSPRRYARRS